MDLEKTEKRTPSQPGFFSRMTGGIFGRKTTMKQARSEPEIMMFDKCYPFKQTTNNPHLHRGTNVGKNNTYSQVNIIDVIWRKHQDKMTMKPTNRTIVVKHDTNLLVDRSTPASSTKFSSRDEDNFGHLEKIENPNEMAFDN